MNSGGPSDRNELVPTTTPVDVRSAHSSFHESFVTYRHELKPNSDSSLSSHEFVDGKNGAAEIHLSPFENDDATDNRMLTRTTTTEVASSPSSSFPAEEMETKLQDLQRTSSFVDSDFLPAKQEVRYSIPNKPITPLKMQDCDREDGETGVEIRQEQFDGEQQDSNSKNDSETSGGEETSINIIEFPTPKLLEMLTALLNKIVKSNDKLAYNEPKLHQDGIPNNGDMELVQSVLSFRGKHIPQISLDQYFQRIEKYCPITNDVFLSLLVYFDRISKRCNMIPNCKNDDNDGNDDEIDVAQQEMKTQESQIFVMDSYNIHRLIIAGVTVSTKFFSDLFYSNSRYARVGGITLQELNHLELQFLLLCDFQLLISAEELQKYGDLLSRFWKNSNETFEDTN